MSHFICPVCGAGLRLSENSFVCGNKHSFDKSKSGYVNLLLSQKRKSRRHGDDKLMVRARKGFLEKGYYEPLLKELNSVVSQFAENGSVILDIGCGEGYYTSGIYSELLWAGIKADMLGIDISKDAVDLFARSNRQTGYDIELAAASAFKIPVADNSVDIGLSIFAPESMEEVLRLLKPEGKYIRVYPLEKHLLELKNAVYDKVYENPPAEHTAGGLKYMFSREIKYSIYLDSADDIQSLFMMTPYYYKTGRADQEKLGKLKSLETKIEFGIDVYTK